MGLRIQKELLDNIKRLAEEEGVDRNSWIKHALGVFVAEELNGMADQAINDYINLSIDEKTLLEFCEFEEVPKDLKDARAKKLQNLVEET